MFKKPEFSEKQETQNKMPSENRSARFQPEDRLETSIMQAKSGENVEKKGEWVDKGIQNVAVDQINLEDSWVRGEQDFHKVSPQEFRRGFQVLEKEVKPAVAKGAIGDDFYHQDRARGLEYQNGSEKIYDAFYGQSSIRLEKIGDQYHVINGYHRLYIANEMGIEMVPARVIEKQI